MFKFQFYFLKLCHCIFCMFFTTATQTQSGRNTRNKRYSTVVFICTGYWIAHAMRTNLSITAVRLLDVNHTAANYTDKAEIDWNSVDVGILHAAFYIGLLITHLPAALISIYYPAHSLFCWSIFLSSISNFFLPSVINTSYASSFILRFAQGCFEAFYFQTSHIIIRQWIPPQERSVIGSFVFAGMYGGAILGYPLNSAIAYHLGEKYSYYIFGSIGILYSILFALCVYEKPCKDTKITDEELSFIEKSKKEIDYIFDANLEDPTVPWCDIFLSKPVWAVHIAQFASSWVFYQLLSNQLVFLNQYGYSLTENGLVSVIPYVFMVLIILCSGFIADFLRSRKMSTRNLRKLMTFLGFIGQAVCLIVISTTNDDRKIILYLTIGTGLSGFIVSGWRINHQDIACNYSSVLNCLSATVGELASVLSLICTGYMTKHQTLSEWHSMFTLSGFILLGATIFYLKYASGSTQNWALRIATNQKIVYTSNSISNRKMAIQSKENDPMTIKFQ